MRLTRLSGRCGWDFTRGLCGLHDALPGQLGGRNLDWLGVEMFDRGGLGFRFVALPLGLSPVLRVNAAALLPDLVGTSGDGGLAVGVHVGLLAMVRSPAIPAFD